MSKKRRDLDYLGDIQESLQRIKAYTKGLNLESFANDNKTQDAVVRNLEVMGEAQYDLRHRNQQRDHHRWHGAEALPGRPGFERRQDRGHRPG